MNGLRALLDVDVVGLLLWVLLGRVVVVVPNVGMGRDWVELLLGCGCC